MCMAPRALGLTLLHMPFIQPGMSSPDTLYELEGMAFILQDPLPWYPSMQPSWTVTSILQPSVHPNWAPNPQL